jgi:hypothetical protein
MNSSHGTASNFTSLYVKKCNLNYIYSIRLPNFEKKIIEQFKPWKFKKINENDFMFIMSIDYRPRNIKGIAYIDICRPFLRSS